MLVTLIRRTRRQTELPCEVGDIGQLLDRVTLGLVETSGVCIERQFRVRVPSELLNCLHRSPAVRKEADVGVPQRVKAYLVSVPVDRWNTGPLHIGLDKVFRVHPLAQTGEYPAGAFRSATRVPVERVPLDRGPVRRPGPTGIGPPRARLRRLLKK